MTTKKLYRLECINSTNPVFDLNDWSSIEMGSYIGSRHEFDIQDLLVNRIKPDSSLIQDKSFYRYPNLSLPRNKMDILKEKSNIKVTRKKDDADYKVVSLNTIDKLLEINWSNSIQVKTIKDGILKDANILDDLVKLFDGMEDDAYVCMRYVYGNNFGNKLYDLMGTLDYESSCLYVTGQNESILNDILSATNLVLDIDMVALCNSDSLILDYEQYKNMKSMIKSPDKTNKALALEMLANCNIEKSFDYASMIYYFLHEHLKDATNWNSINVKTLRNRLSNFDAYTNTSRGSYYNRYLKALINEGQLTDFAFKEVMRFMYVNVIKTSTEIDEDSVFKFDINALSLNPKYSINNKEE